MKLSWKSMLLEFQNEKEEELFLKLLSIGVEHGLEDVKHFSNEIIKTVNMMKQGITKTT